ncbi:MAG: hypothetical protein Q9227_006342 [Pyrenula ochraceoflavens]
MAEEKASPLAIIGDNAIVSTLKGYYTSFAKRREALGLSNPGTVEGISREVQRDVLLSNLMFSGLRADATKVFSINPLFRIQHGLAMGSQALPPYTLTALFGTDKLFLQGGLSNDGSVSAWCNYKWATPFTSKVQMQVQPGSPVSAVSIDHEYTGKDFSASLKSMNPSILEGGLTGILVGSYLQSVTPNLSLGLEAMWQRQSLGSPPSTALSYVGRYKGSDWIASGQMQGGGAFEASYWRRLTEKVEAGVNLQLAFPSPGLFGSGREGTCAFGAKYDFRASSFRAQIDSAGKVGAYLDKRVAPMISISFAGEIDQVKQQPKIGLAVSVESAPDELMEGVESNAGPQAVTPPF